MIAAYAQQPFALSLSKGCPSLRPLKEGQGFDKLSPNGERFHP
ncbi:hypothetical protein Q5H94_08895 [Sphingomonas sp. CA1-15]|uniref:Uncharacterized protein n=1 Tax=Sphingomonas immobilis TaxID=3063997 RepID=A0ABT8ZXY5_9SPHN|nr:hypothetical protein [Sphingomonas sp. CA1-15]